MYPFSEQSSFSYEAAPTYPPSSDNSYQQPLSYEQRVVHQPVWRDYGPQPLVVNIEKAAEINPNYRTAIWTGKHLQVTLMSINPGEDIGLEIHPVTDQFLRIESGKGLVQMGEQSNALTYQQPVSDGFAVMVPANTWHNVINTGTKPLKLYSIYAPPHHPHGTIQQTKAIAEAAQAHHGH
ncbi:cupin domain-containing protein [Sporolactobacillus spathodeae]